ncbi:Na/Pi symporter [uncultured Parvibaculum sp.]|uniref:Na/Pi cotransporter family protein n=1 Tax=uncultured Parvibaculum sp. TaxID=291828 RepID=UPI0030ED6F91|tara:strand:- start:16469 stop:18148 length:1680 start_codon:yes stop_codon:yes gene_type:complete
MSIESATGLLGGLGLFLVGMWLMTDGLKVAAGPSLKQILERWTDTRAKGLLAGFALTALVQSSSAVTVTAIGFVNAGVLTLGHAVWVIFGSAVGTTMTGWIVSAVGFNVDIKFMALPAIGIGMILRLTAPGRSRGAIGEAIAGFGIFFLGVSVLKDSFEGVAAGLQLDAFSGSGFLHYLAFVLAGFGVTAMAQSSSASIAIALSAVSGGLIGIESGAAMVIGANIGTTVTGVVAVLDATSNAKRVAASHFVFNLLSASIALLIMPVFFLTLSWLKTTGLTLPGPAMTLAIFHTLFNVAGLLVIWMWADDLIAWLKGLFVSQEENEARPQHLDQTLVDMPTLAIESLMLEMRRLSGIVLEGSASYLNDPVRKESMLRSRFIVFESLADSIRSYAATLSEARLTSGLPDALAHLLRALQHCNAIVHEMRNAMSFVATESRMPSLVRERVESYRNALVALMQDSRLLDDQVEADWLGAQGRQFEDGYQATKQFVLSAASRGDLKHLAYLDDAMREADLMRRIAHHVVRSAARFKAARDALTMPESSSSTADVNVADEVIRNE